MHHALQDGVQRISVEGFRFDLGSINEVLKKYPNVDKPEFRKRLDDLFETASVHILQMVGAVTGGLVAQAQKFDQALNEVPELAAIFREQEQVHQEKVAREEAVKPSYAPRKW